MVKRALPHQQESDLPQKGDELTVQVGTYKRKLILPRTLLGRPIAGARFTANRLSIRFGERESAVKAGESENSET